MSAEFHSPIVHLLAASGWTIRAQPVDGSVLVEARKDGVTIRHIAATADDCTVPIFQEAMRHREAA